MTHQIRSRMVRRAAGIAVLAMVGVACGGSSDGEEAAVSTPVTEEADTPVTAAPTTAAPVVTEAPVVEETIDAADIPSVPCAEYVAESGYPLKPCDSGVLVETLQRDLESLFPEIAIDGLYGGQTFGFVEEIQTAAGDDVTGLVSEALAEQIAAAGSLDDLGIAGEAPAETVTEEAENTEGEAVVEETEGDGDDLTTEELCNELIGNPDAEEFTATMIETCSDIGIDLVGEG